MFSKIIKRKCKQFSKLKKKDRKLSFKKFKKLDKKKIRTFLEIKKKRSKGKRPKTGLNFLLKTLNEHKRIIKNLNSKISLRARHFFFLKKRFQSVCDKFFKDKHPTFVKKLKKSFKVFLKTKPFSIISSKKRKSKYSAFLYFYRLPFKVLLSFYIRKKKKKNKINFKENSDLKFFNLKKRVYRLKPRKQKVIYKGYKFKYFLKKRFFEIKIMPFFLFILFFKNLGFFINKRFIFRNLKSSFRKFLLVKDFKRLQEEKDLKKFRKQKFYREGCRLLFLHSTNFSDLASIFSKYVVKFFRLLYNKRKFNFFLRFVEQIILLIFTYSKTKENGVLGFRLKIRGRFRKAPRTRRRIYEFGQIPLHTVDSKISYNLTHVNTLYGVFGIKIWICEKG